MYRSCYKFPFNLVLCAFGLFLFIQNGTAQEDRWIKETPTGKVSVWITQLEPKDSLVFELMVINGSGETIEIDPLNTNTNSFVIRNSLGEHLGMYYTTVCGSQEWYDALLPKTYRTWNIDVLKIIQKQNPEIGLYYSLTWKVGSSIGTFQAKPITFYFEK